MGRELPHSSFGEDELPYLPLINMRNSIFLNQLEFHVDCFVHYFSCFVQNSRVHITFYKRSLTCRKRQTSKVLLFLVFLWISLLMFLCPVRTDFCRNPYYNCDFPGVHCSMLSTNAIDLGLFSWKSKGTPQWPPKEIRPSIKGSSTTI